MKKFFLLLIVINNIAYGQYKEVYDENIKSEFFKCTGTMFNNCNNGYYIDNVKYNCPNCKNWANSYRNSRGCDVCKNNKYIIKKETVKCSACNGLGKIRNTYYTKEGYAKRAEIRKEQQKEDSEKLSFENDLLQNSKIIVIGDSKIRYQFRTLSSRYTIQEAEEIANASSWRLPSKDELEALFLNEEARNVFVRMGEYWCYSDSGVNWFGYTDGSAWQIERGYGDNENTKRLLMLVKSIK